MRQIEDILLPMDELLDALIINAQKLLAVSKQNNHGDELELLQQQQSDLLADLLDKDELFTKKCEKLGRDYQSPRRDLINQKLDTFQNLNTSFLANITTLQNMMQLDHAKSKKSKKS